MIVGIVMSVAAIATLCVLAYRLATHALPFMIALAAARFAHGTGAGLVGAGLVGLAAAAASFAILAFLFATARAPILRVTIAVIFAAPAAVAGYAIVHGVAADIVPSPIWRQIFSITGAIAVGVSALARLAAPLPPVAR
ncbi:hypothetical protein [Aquamicrobium sp. LC103]|uniref:hypothetical protein n=1 Tax=Aquamicrobium sp. LC103 TaxID=1120658 RepID=UPI00063E7A01|nr:hypothetical protein [Aquamicrobium sp. LC103]TKT82466.1 hypothetical protein XW59_000420 [Aquamicrobium sp. LC103]